MEIRNKLEESLKFLFNQADLVPEIGLILGSGLGMLAEEIEQEAVIPYRDIPHFPQSTVEGHKGRFVIGRLAGKAVWCMQGRFHYYEGYTMQQITYPIRVLQLAGASKLLVTNASGGINERFRAGSLMLIEDQINLMGNNPLIGANLDIFGPRFPDMSEAYDRTLLEKVYSALRQDGIELHRGVYAGVSGPSYETPAEIRYLRAIGADAVGMSTVPEVIVANHGGMKVVGLSCITNMAAGILDQKLDHAEVVEIAERTRPTIMRAIRQTIKII
jgi:purine-nucleoside phosphorylase